MNRTKKYRIQFYLSILAFIIGYALLVSIIVIGGPVNLGGQIIILSGLFLLLPGRIQSKLWSDYYDGQKFQKEKRHVEALAKYQSFLATLHSKPHLRSLIWLTNWVYTRNIDVMTLNNMGISYLWLDNINEAENSLVKATELDPESPLPYYNLGLVYHAAENSQKAAECLQKAEKLGYNSASIKKVAEFSAEATEKVDHH